MPSFKLNSMRRTTATTLTVAVKCRPLTWKDHGRNIIRVIGSKEVLVLDPDLSKDYLDRVQHRTKEKNKVSVYPQGNNLGVYNSGVVAARLEISASKDLYDTCILSTIAGVVQGLNATVFAYGSTGSGKTYTMVGTQEDPGLMVLSLHTIFDLIKKDSSSDDFEVSCSYLEVYNEVIYDLLEKSSGLLELREDPVRGIVISGLRSIKVHSADKILELLNLGNSRRKIESTEANDASSRSHAVLEILVKRKQKNKYRNQVMQGKLALVDLAGSERASETNSCGKKLRDGANINRSLLALANCINALGKHHKKGLAYVPYRDSKLTRILKDGLSGNSRTVMVATVSPADNQYHHTVNTLKYADRAKEIKTHIQKNIGTIKTHLSDYQRMIDSLQEEVFHLKKELAEKESQLSDRPTDKAADDELSWLNLLSQETSENVQQRINLQRAIFELEEANIRSRTELHHLDDAIAKQQAIENDGIVMQTLRTRRQLILDNIRDNDESGVIYEKQIAANERHRSELQVKINQAIANHGEKTYLRILSQYWLLGMANTELQFEIAKRDEVIKNQREVQRNLWNLQMEMGLDKKRLLDIASPQGTPIEEYMISAPHQSPYHAQHRYPLPGNLPIRNYVTYPSSSQSHGYCYSEHLSRGNTTPVYPAGHYSPYYSWSPNELSPWTHSIVRSPNQASGSSSPSCGRDLTTGTFQSFNFGPAT